GKARAWGLSTPEGRVQWAQQRGAFRVDSSGKALADGGGQPTRVIGPLGAYEDLDVRQSYLFSPDGKMLAIRHTKRIGPKGKGGKTEQKITLHDMPNGKLLH